MTEDHTLRSGRSAYWAAVAVFAAYYALHASLRVALGGHLNIDEAEAWLWAQRLAWGYGPQPPLYIWLQALVFQLTGPTALGLALFKALLLTANAAAILLLVRRWGAVGTATLLTGAAMLFWLPELSWESQRIRTHNVLATLIALLSILQMLRLREGATLPGLVGLGILLGLGLLSKWNFALIPLAGFIVAFPSIVRTLRSAYLIVPIVMVAMVMPTLWWMLSHPEIAFASTAKLGLSGGDNAAVVWTMSFARGLIGFWILPAVAFGLATLGAWRQGWVRGPGEVRFVVLLVVCTVALAFAGGVASGATMIKARWFLPISIALVPVLGTLLILNASGLALRVFRGATVIAAAAIVLGMGSVHLGDQRQPTDNYAILARDLPTGDGRPVLARVSVAANAGLLRPDLATLDVVTLLDRPCDQSLLIIGPDQLISPRVAAYLEMCELVEKGRSAVRDGERVVETVAEFARQ